MFSSFAPERFFNIGGPDSLNDFSPSPLCEVGKHKFCFVLHIVSEAELKEDSINMYLLLRVVLRNWNKLFSQGWAKWTAAQAASHFLVFFFLCLGALICGIRLHNLSAALPTPRSASGQKRQSSPSRMHRQSREVSWSGWLLPVVAAAVSGWGRRQMPTCSQKHVPVFLPEDWWPARSRCCLG